MNDLTSQWKSSQKNDKFCLQSLGLWSFTIVYYENNSTKNKDILTVKITVKPAHAVTSVKQSPVLKGHIFLVLS
jgi:hypothetical protein